jgi:hypothetical protein
MIGYKTRGLQKKNLLSAEKSLLNPTFLWSLVMTLSIQINLSPASVIQAENFGTVYEGCEITEAAGRFTIENPTLAISKVKDNITALTYGIANAMLKIDTYCLTGGAPVWSYLSAINALRDQKVVYSDGRQINSLPIVAFEVTLADQLDDDIQSIDLTINPDWIVDGVISQGYFESVAASVAGGRVSIDGEKELVCMRLMSHIKVNSKTVEVTGAMPIWVYLGLVKSLIVRGIKVVYNDGRNGRFYVN